MTTTTTALETFFANVEGDHREHPWARGAVLDATVPGWRFSEEGIDTLRDRFRYWYAHPGTLEEIRRHATPTGEIVEFTVTWVANGVPHAARQIHVLDLDDEGRISRDEMWCGGQWSAELLARMEAARDAG